MAADVIEAAQLPIETAYENQRFANHFGGEEISWIRNLAGMADDLPGAAENLISLDVKYLG